MVPRVISFLVLAAALLTGCNSPSPRFAHAQRYDASAGGSTFIIYIRADEAEIYRTSMEMMPSRSATFAKAVQAVQATTPCTVVDGSMAGDAALMTAQVRCP
ncbi:MAG: hypothetical protein P8X77_12825 [Maritimibacter sp.]|jgi:hypothetical protein